MKLPKYVVFKSMYNDKYLRCRVEAGEQQGFLQFSGDDAAARDSKFEVSYSSGGLIHLKCCANNKYWARSSSRKWWIRCGSDRPVQDQSDWSCTLFELVPVDGIDGGFRFLHVQLKQYACSFNSGPPFGDCLYAGSRDQNEEDLRDVFVVIDASSKAKLPKKHVTTTLPRFVVLKSRYNHKYVRYRHGRGAQEGFLQVSEENPTSQYAKFEVVKAKRYDDDDDDDDEEELVHLKCCYNNKYWASSSEGHWWISGSAKKPKEARAQWSCTLFKPVYLRGGGDPASIRLQHVQLGRYACLFRSENSPYGDCLYMASEEPSSDLSDVFTFIDWEEMASSDDDDPNDDDEPPKREKWRPREEKPRRHRPRGEDKDRGRGRGREEDREEERHREVASDGEEEDVATPAERRAEEKDEYGEYGSDGEGKSNPNRRMWPPSSSGDGAAPKKGSTTKAGSYVVDYMVVACANDFWGTLFASTAILPEADPDYYSSIKQVKGNGFTERSVRKIDFATGRMPQWKDWREQILSVNHGSKELKASAVHGGPLNQCGSFKTTVVVSPRFENEAKSHGCNVKWKCEYTDSKGFDLQEMMKLVLRTFRRLDDFLHATAARERG